MNQLNNLFGLVGHGKEEIVLALIRGLPYGHVVTRCVY